MRLKFAILALFITTVGFSQSVDSVLIKGQVISRDNNPLPGVMVKVSNTNKETIADLYGQFELWTPIEGIIEFSCISEPYKISLSSIGVPKENELIKFKFDFKQNYSNYKTKRLKGRTIRINKIKQGHISDIILAYYDSDFERITQKYYDFHHNQNHKIIFLLDGNVMNEDFTPNDLNYNSVEKITIIRITDINDKIIFMISTKAK